MNIFFYKDGVGIRKYTKVETPLNKQTEIVLSK